MTSELSGGVRFAELAGWPQHERDLAAETIYRFVFRSLYDVRAFNGDPHPGNYLFHRGGRVTFLDFGLVRHFTPAELQPLMQMARTICVEHDPEAFRRSLENAGFLRPGAPLSTQAIVDHLAVFYDTIREPGPRTITSDYASSVVRRFFDLRSPVAELHRRPAAVRDPPAHQPRAVRGARRAVRHRRLARHLRGNLALHPWPGVHPDGTSRGRMGDAAPGHGGVTGLRSAPDGARNWQVTRRAKEMSVTTTTPGMQLPPGGQPRLAAGSWRVDPAQSDASFAASVVGRPVRGRLPLSGEVLITEPIEDSTARLAARAGAVSTGSPVLDRLLAGPGFLDAVAYPEISFRSELLAWVPAGWRAVGRLQVKNAEHELACQSRSAPWRHAAGRLPAHPHHQQLGHRLQVGNQPVDSRTWPPHRDDVLMFPRTGHVSRSGVIRGRL